MPLAFIGLGANLGDPVAHVRGALTALAALPHTRLLRSSSLYRTAPVGYRTQPDFVNAVAALDTTLDPPSLLAALRAIETAAGRERTFPNAPRTLDLDLLLYGDAVIDAPALCVPHPRMHERAFVLAPLVEIAPQATIPGRGLAADWLARAGAQRIERLEVLR